MLHWSGETEVNPYVPLVATATVTEWREMMLTAKNETGGARKSVGEKCHGGCIKNHNPIQFSWGKRKR